MRDAGALHVIGQFLTARTRLTPIRNLDPRQSPLERLGAIGHFFFRIGAYLATMW